MNNQTSSLGCANRSCGPRQPGRLILNGVPRCHPPSAIQLQYRCPPGAVDREFGLYFAGNVAVGAVPKAWEQPRDSGLPILMSWRPFPTHLGRTDFLRLQQKKCLLLRQNRCLFCPAFNRRNVCLKSRHLSCLQQGKNLDAACNAAMSRAWSSSSETLSVVSRAGHIEARTN